MKVVLFCQSVLSCWNNGHVHFTRGTVRELIKLGHRVEIYEPEDGWSRTNAIKDGGAGNLAEAAALVPGLAVSSYRDNDLDLDEALEGADLVIVQEWNTPALIASVGRHRIMGGRYAALFHDAHHRSVTAAAELDGFDLDGYDGVLAFGEVVRQQYLKRGWARRAFTWHEAADTALFRPLQSDEKNTDLIWIGNWGDEERSRELNAYLIGPAAKLGLRTNIYGVRYPEPVQRHLAALGLVCGGWLPNHRAPEAYSAARVTVHVPRRPYAEALRGIPTIRVFEALACGIPLVCSPWRDEEGLFPEGAYLTVSSEAEMCAALASVMHDRELAQQFVETGLRAIHDRHTCAHRVRELISITTELKRAEKAPEWQQGRAAAERVPS